MQELNEYLQELVSKSGSELKLEPNKQPYVVTSNGNDELTNAPLQGAKINTMIFSLMPSDVKQKLPSSSEVEFIHPHNLGDFNFLVKKSPSGFIVTVSPSAVSAAASQDLQPQVSEVAGLNALSPPTSEEYDWLATANNPAPAQEVDSPDQEFVIEHNSPPRPQNDPADANIRSEELLSTSDYALDKANESAVQENGFENFQTQAQDPKQYSQIEIKEDVVDQEPIYKVDEFETESAVNTPNNFNSVPPASIDQTVAPPTEHLAQNIAAQDPNTHAPPAVGVPPAMQQDQQQHLVNEQTPPTVMPTPPTPQQVYVEPAKAAAPTVAPNPQAKASMDALFHKMNQMGASDLHMSVSVPPMVRKDGKMAILDPSQPALNADIMKQLLQSIMPQKNIEEFAKRKDTDFAYEIKGLARFRANIFMDRKGMGGVFRIIPSEILTAEKLGLSKHIMNLCELSKGLVVVTGPTGSGKSTTLCAMVDSINKSREDHIITIEDPIEFTHENQKCLVNQREVHNHTDSFKDALRAALREDPDILLVGEMRDLETISIAIETAETGHLVFGTLHTTTAASTVDRIIDQFPADRQQQVRVMLSESLRGVIAQTLLPKIGGGRIAALEVLIITPAISNLIREGKTFQIPSSMQTGKNKGMVMLNDALMDLVNKGLVLPKDAYIKSVDKEGFEALLKRNGKSI